MKLQYCDDANADDDHDDEVKGKKLLEYALQPQLYRFLLLPQDKEDASVAWRTTTTTRHLYVLRCSGFDAT